MLWWSFLRKKILIWSNPRFFMPRWSRVLNGPRPRKQGSGQSRVETSLREDGQAQPRSQGTLSSYLEKATWLRLVTCLCIQIKSAPAVGLWLNCVKTVYGGESCFASRTLFLKLSKLFVRDPANLVPRAFPLKVGGAGKSPGIGWSPVHLTP